MMATPKTSKRELARQYAYRLGRQAADERRCGISPYEKPDPGWFWVDGYETRMGELRSPEIKCYCFRCEDFQLAKDKDLRLAKGGQ